MLAISTVDVSGPDGYVYDPTIEDLFFAVERRIIGPAGDDAGGNLQLVSRQVAGCASAGVDVTALDPASERQLGHAQLTRDLRQAALTDQLNRFRPEASGYRHGLVPIGGLLSQDPMIPHSQVSTKPGQVQSVMASPAEAALESKKHPEPPLPLGKHQAV